MRRSRVLPAFSLLVLTQCSLLGYDNFTLPLCQSDIDCDGINQRNGIAPTACDRYICDATRTCSRRSQKQEICDGIDNNCNGVVDEDTLRAVDDTASTLAAATFSSVSFNASSNGVVGVAVSPIPHAMPATLVSTASNRTPAAPVAIRPRTALFGSPGSNNGMNWPSWTLTEGSCSNAGNTTTTECRIAEAAVTATDRESEWFAITIDPSGCGSGKVRFGLVDSSAGSAWLDVRGPRIVSNTFDAIDVFPLSNPPLNPLPPQEGCSGRSRTPLSFGAARPAIQRSNTDSKTALAAWIGAPINRARCGGDSAPVEALGLTVETSIGIRGLHASNAPMGTPTPATLGRTTGGGAPAIIALAAGGWLTAFGDESGGVTLRVVSALAPVAALPTPMGMGSIAPGDSVRPTQPIELGAPVLLARTSMMGTADHVSLAIRTIGENTLVGVAWVEGCGSTSGSVHFAQLSLSGTTLTERGRAMVARDVDAATTSIVALEDRVIDRSNNAAQGGDRGGWMIAFESTRSLQAIRVSSATITTVDRVPMLLASQIVNDRRAPLLVPSPTAPAAVSWHSELTQAARYATVCGWNPTAAR